MAIAIRPIPVLTGTAAQRFEAMLEENKQSPFTVISFEQRRAVRDMQERSRNAVIKMPAQ